MNIEIFSYSFVFVGSFVLLFLSYQIVGMRNLFFLYLSLLVVFFLFRSGLLILGFDKPFPEDMFTGQIEASHYLKGLFGFLIWVITFILLMVIHRPAILMSDLVSSPQKEARALEVAIYLTFALSTVYFVSAAIQAGGIERLLFYVRINREYSFGFLSSVPPVGLMVSAGYLALYERKMSILAISVVLALYQFSLGDRSGVIFALVVYCLSGFYSGNTRLFSLVISIPIIFVLAVLSKWYRNVHQLGFSLSDTGVLRDISSSLNLNIYDCYYLAISRIEDLGGFRLGYDLYLGFIGLIPRVFWSGKPDVINTGVWFAQAFSNRSMGTPISALGEWYINFGFMGFVVGALITFYFVKLALFLVPKYKSFYLIIGTISVFQVVQSGFSNASLRELLMLTFLLILPIRLLMPLRVRIGRQNARFAG